MHFEQVKIFCLFFLLMLVQNKAIGAKKNWGGLEPPKGSKWAQTGPKTAKNAPKTRFSVILIILRRFHARGTPKLAIFMKTNVK